MLKTAAFVKDSAAAGEKMEKGRGARGRDRVARRSETHHPLPSTILPPSPPSPPRFTARSRELGTNLGFLHRTKAPRSSGILPAGKKRWSGGPGFEARSRDLHLARESER